MEPFRRPFYLIRVTHPFTCYPIGNPKRLLKFRVCYWNKAAAQMQSQKMKGKVQRDQFGPRDHSVCVSYIDCFCFASSSTPLHLAVRSNNMVLIEILLSDSRTDCERQDKEGFVPLWYALQNPVNRRKLWIEKNKTNKLKVFVGFRGNCRSQSSSQSSAHLVSTQSRP